MAKLSFKTLISRARATAPLPQAEVALSREAAEIERGVAKAAFDAAQAAYRVGLVDADNDTLKQLAQDQADAGLRLDRAQALCDRFDAQLAAIHEAEEQAAEDERRAALARTIESAARATKAFQEAASQDIPEMIAKARNLVDLGIAAERARTTAIQALKAADEDVEIPAVAAFRTVAGLKEKQISTAIVELWVRPDGEIAGYQDEIRISPDGSGFFIRPTMQHGHRYSHKRKFERVEYLPETSPRHSVALVEPLRKIARELGRLAPPTEPSEAERRPQIRLKPVGDVVDVVAVQKGTDAARRAEKNQMPVPETRSQARPTPAVVSVEPTRAERLAMRQNA